MQRLFYILGGKGPELWFAFLVSVEENKGVDCEWWFQSFCGYWFCLFSDRIKKLGRRRGSEKKKESCNNGSPCPAFLCSCWKVTGIVWVRELKLLMFWVFLFRSALSVPDLLLRDWRCGNQGLALIEKLWSELAYKGRINRKNSRDLQNLEVVI